VTEPVGDPGPSQSVEVASELSTEETLGDFTTKPAVLLLVPLAFLIGALGAGISLALLDMIGLFTNLLYFQRLSVHLVSPYGNTLGAIAVIIPVGGGLIIGFMARFGREQIRDHGIPEAMERNLINGSRVQPRLAILKPISSAISIGSGGPFGAEGPIILTGGAALVPSLASSRSQWPRRLPGAWRRLRHDPCRTARPDRGGCAGFALRGQTGHLVGRTRKRYRRGDPRPDSDYGRRHRGCHGPRSSGGYLRRLGIDRDGALAGVTRSPFTAIVFAFELTHDQNSLLALLVVATVSHLASVLLLKRSILTEKVARRGFHVMREYSMDPLEATFVREVMDTDVFTVEPTRPLSDLYRALDEGSPERRQRLYPVLDADGDLVGVLPWSAVLAARASSQRVDAAMIAPPAIAFADEILPTVADRMATHGVGVIPVVDRADRQHLEGLITQFDLFQARQNLLEEERHAERVLTLRRVASRRLEAESMRVATDEPGSLT
jgi:CBS domain-containing protein